MVPTHEECFWAMLALSGKLHFAKRDLESVGECVKKEILIADTLLEELKKK